MLKRILIFVAGIVFGVLFTLLATGWGFISEFTGVTLIDYLYESFSPKYQYFELKKDLSLSNGSLLKKGTVIRFDQGMNEGYSIFALYLKHKGNAEASFKNYPFAGDQKQIIDSYWLNEADTIHAKGD